MKHRQRLELGLVSWRLGLDFFWRFVSLIWGSWTFKQIPSLKVTAKHLKNGWLEYDRFLLGRLIFQVRAVSFREGKKMRFQVKGKVHSVHPHIQELNRCYSSKKSNCFCKKTLYKQSFWWGGKSLPTLQTSMFQKIESPSNHELKNSGQSMK